MHLCAIQILVTAYLLVVIVVSTVLGALLIICIVALTVVSCRWVSRTHFLGLFTQTFYGCNTFIFVCASIYDCRDQKESSSPEVDFSSNYGNTELHKPTGVPRIPRANPDASWKSNNLEMTNSGSNQALVTRDRPESKAVRTFLTVCSKW